MKGLAQRILIVDDEPLILEVLDIQFSAMGMTARISGSPETALGIIPEFQPDIILSDFRMPSMDGVEFLQRVRSQGLQTPFFLMTGFSDNHHAGIASELQLSGTIEKPFQIAELKSMIRQFLEKRAPSSPPLTP